MDGNWATFFGVMSATLKDHPKLWRKWYISLDPKRRDRVRLFAIPDMLVLKKYVLSEDHPLYVRLFWKR
jgi:hypothetical protein